ncbi:MAG: acyloxyacyl hydrolase, partial [Verrucomicrobiota bacterium]
MKKTIPILLSAFIGTAACLAETDRNHYNQLLLGSGSSIKGFGETSQEVRTVDVLWRHARIFHEKEEGLLRGNHEFWIEAPVSIILSDTDAMDSHDFGIVGLNFLFAWIFPETAIGEPYFMIGGGPQYVLADIEGVGSDLCGNYQTGIGTRFLFADKHPVNLEIRYHHISNLGMAEPNIPLNSVKVFVGATLP